MEDVLSERRVAHGSSRLALFVVVGLAIGDAAVLRGDERGTSGQAASAASLFPPQSIAPGLIGQPETRQANAVLAPPNRPAGVRVHPENEFFSGDLKPRRQPFTPSASFSSQRMVEQAAQHLVEAEASLRRQARFSAKASTIESLRLLAEARDYATGETTAAVHLREGLVAIRESRDFMGRYDPVDRDDIERMVQSHATDVLKDADPSRLTGASAADIYLNDAREHLTSVATGNPVAARALLVLSEIYRQEKTLGPHADGIALNLLRAALQATPGDPSLANELGFLLMKQGILDEAQWALEHSLAITPSVSAGQNLAEVLRQRGDLQGASELLARLNDPQGFPAPTRTSTGPNVQMLTPQQFAALSRPQQAFAPSATGNIAAPPAPITSSQAIDAAATIPSAQNEPAPGPVGRVAKAVSGWFQ